MTDIEHLNFIIKRLEEENKQLRGDYKALQERFMALLDPEAFAKFKIYTQDRKPQQAVRPKTVDNATGKLREKTENELAEDFKALQELGIL